MADAANGDWDHCSVEGCTGAASGQSGRCLAHLSPEDLETALERIGRDGHVVACGVAIGRQLLRRIVDALRRGGDEAPRFEEADFRGAVFTEEADLRGATFARLARFDGARFVGSARFDQTSFIGEAIFEAAAFEVDVTFVDADFKRDGRFNEARFAGSASFDGATFTGHAGFANAAFASRAGLRRTTFMGVGLFFQTTFGQDADFAKATFTRDADFSLASFAGNAEFGEASFEGDTAFEATFNGEADFSKATFGQEADFANATFAGGYATFSEATFKGVGQFQVAVFKPRTEFDQTSFEGRADFSGTTFAGDAAFRSANFAHVVAFSRATFRGAAEFQRASFANVVQFNSVAFAADARFDFSKFDQARRFGPLLARGRLSLDDVLFLEPADIYVGAERLSLVRARFPEGVNVWARWAEVVFERADFGAPSILAASSPFTDLDDSELSYLCDSLRSERPRLLSLRWANAANLTVSGVDLSACRFVGAHHLDALRLERGSSFAGTPRHHKVTSRQAIAEEHEWRKSHSTPLSAPGWYPQECLLPNDLPESQLEATDVATIYRDLRKGREDNKDEPGAADFYYGEMEMRRLAGSAAHREAHQRAQVTHHRRSPGRLSAPRGEHLILTLYWLVSGYGLRASRALGALVATVFVFAALLHFWGFDSNESFIQSLTFSLESTTSLFRAPERALTTTGEWLQMGLRLLGPLFFGLALLSLRGRVKR